MGTEALARLACGLPLERSLAIGWLRVLPNSLQCFAHNLRVRALKHYILREEQLAYLDHTITFDEIDPFSEEDLREMNRLCHAFSANVALDCFTLSTADLYQRPACGCASRWGLIIELLIEALVIAKPSKDRAIEAKHFCQAFPQRFELRPGYSPFSIESCLTSALMGPNRANC